jgi:hypothetical protein
MKAREEAEQHRAALAAKREMAVAAERDAAPPAQVRALRAE